MQSVDAGVLDRVKYQAASAGSSPVPPSNTNSVQATKNALAMDPYNIYLIRDLGFAYARDSMWKQCSNVLQRGWSRVDEIQDIAQRVEFGMKLSEACYKCSRFNEAKDILSQLEEPSDGDQYHRFMTLSCQIYSVNANRQLALKAFHHAIEAQTFDQILSVWAVTQADLVKVGAYDSARMAIERAAVSEEDRQRLSILDSLTDASSDASNVKKGDIALHRRLFTRFRAFCATSPLSRFTVGAARIDRDFRRRVTNCMHRCRTDAVCRILGRVS